MDNTINNLFLQAMSSSKKSNSYKAFFDIGNDQIGITAAYSMDVLKMVITEPEYKKYKLLRIEKA